MKNSNGTLGAGDIYYGNVSVIKGSGAPYVVNTLVEAGSSTFTVTLRVVGGDEKGSLKTETVKYGHESHGTQQL
jgi:hypothetical protein